MEGDFQNPAGGPLKQKLDALLKKDLFLPVVPAAITRVIQTFDNPDLTPQALAREIAEDPVLTIQLLKTANSAYFGLARNVDTPNEAVRLLGIDKVRALVMASAIQACFHTLSSTKLEMVWSISLNCADVGASVATMLELDRATAYTAGVLHSVGMLVMHAGMPELVDKLDYRVHPASAERPQAERALFGYSYAEAGAALLRDWGLPRRFVDALEHQFTPLDNDRHEVLACVLNLAGWRARAEFCQLTPKDMAITYPCEVGLILNIDHDLMLGDIPGRVVREVELEEA